MQNDQNLSPSAPRCWDDFLPTRLGEHFGAKVEIHIPYLDQYHNAFHTVRLLSFYGHSVEKMSGPHVESDPTDSATNSLSADSATTTHTQISL